MAKKAAVPTTPRVPDGCLVTGKAYKKDMTFVRMNTDLTCSIRALTALNRQQLGVSLLKNSTLALSLNDYCSNLICMQTDVYFKDFDGLL